MPTPSYDELSDAPAYDELSDAPAYGELSDKPAPSLYDLRAAEFDAAQEPEKPFQAPSSIGEALKQGWQAGNEDAADSVIGLPARALALLPRLKAQTVQDAIDVVTPGLPLDAQSQPPSLAAQRIAGVVNVGRGVGDSLVSPLGISTLGMGSAPAIAQRAVSGAFLADIAASVPELARTAGEASVIGTPQEKVEAYGNLGVVPAFAAGVGLHALSPRTLAPVSDIPNPDVVARNAIIENAQQAATDNGLHRTSAALEDAKNARTIKENEKAATQATVQPVEGAIQPEVQAASETGRGIPSDVPGGIQKASLADQVAAMPPAEFLQWSKDQRKAGEVSGGADALSGVGVEKLKELAAKADVERDALSPQIENAQTPESLAPGVMEAHEAAGLKGQFFREAIKKASKVETPKAVSPLEADIAAENANNAAMMEVIRAKDFDPMVENPRLMELGREMQTIKNRYQGRKPSDVQAEQVAKAKAAPAGEPWYHWAGNNTQAILDSGKLTGGPATVAKGKPFVKNPADVDLVFSTTKTSGPGKPVEWSSDLVSGLPPSTLESPHIDILARNSGGKMVSVKDAYLEGVKSVQELESIGKKRLTSEEASKTESAPIGSKSVEAPAAEAAPAEPVNPELVTSGALGAEGLSPAGVSQPLSQGSQLAQLTEVIKTRKPSPSASIPSRIGDAVKTAESEWAKGKDAVTAGLGKLKAVSTALADSYANLPKWTSFEDAVGKWSGADNASGVEVRKFQQDVNKSVPSKLRQDAITNWIQADGDPAVLAQRAAASKPDVRAGYEEALKLTPDEQTLARNIGQYLESRLQEGIDTGLLKNGVDNYVTQVWKKENPVTNKLQSDLFGSGNLNPNFKYARQRVFDSYFEGEQAGFKPQNKSIGALIAHYDAAFNKSLASRSFIKALHEGTTPDGDPIVEVSGKTIPVPQGQNVPEAFLIKPRANDAATKDGRPYRVVDHWALRDWKWQTEGADGQPVLVQGDLLVHPDYVGKLKNMLGKSALTSQEGVAAYTTRPALQLGALAKQTKLSLSGFHLTQEAVHGLGHRVNPANLVELDMKALEQRALVDHGLQVADPRAAELFGEGLAGGGLVGKIPGLGKVQVAFNDWLFKDYIPRLKMTMALDALERNRKVYSKDIKSGKITDDQLQALTSRQANAAFGELNYRMMGRSPTVQDFLRLTTLAPDFLEARSRFVGQALKPYGREQQVALGLMGATLYVTGRILNQYLDDNPHWDKPFAVYHDGREYRLRTVLGDVQHLVTDPRRFFYNRMSALSRITTELATGKDDRGMNRSFWDQAKDAASWFMPIALEKRSDTTRPQALVGSLGVSSRPYTARTDLYDLVDKWKKNNPDPKIQEQYEQAKQETRPESAYKKLRDYVRKDDAEAALKEYENLRKTHSDKQIWQAFTVKPFTGGLASEHAFHDSLTPEQQKLYHKAIMEQIAEGQKLSEMIRKAPKPAGF